MGRSGGGHGGGGHGGGGRSGGGFSGGSRSGGSFSSRSFSGGGRSGGGHVGAGHRSGGPGPRPGGGGPHWGGGYRRHGGSGLFPFLLGMSIGRSQSGGSSRAYDNDSRQNEPASQGSGSPLLRGCLVVLIIFLLIYMVSCAAGVMRSASTVSATAREPIDASIVTETAYYSDEDGSWISSASTLESGLRYFYQKTNIQPYVIILPNGQTTSGSELETLARTRYDELFQDEGHFLMVFCDDGNGSFNWSYCGGNQTKTVMDSEAVSVLNEQLYDAYQNAETDEGVFSDAFRNTADIIMDTSMQNMLVSIKWIVIVVVAVIVIVALVVFIKNRRAKKAAEEAREQAEFEEKLKTPLETIGDKDIEDLADKYEDDNQSTPFNT